MNSFSFVKRGPLTRARPVVPHLWTHFLPVLDPGPLVDYCGPLLAHLWIFVAHWPTGGESLMARIGFLRHVSNCPSNWNCFSHCSALRDWSGCELRNLCWLVEKWGKWIQEDEVTSRAECWYQRLSQVGV